MKRIFSLVLVGIFSVLWTARAGTEEDPNQKILKQGLLGAGVGAISAGASGGKAGKGALIGAGTNVIGGALLDSLTGPSTPPPVQRIPQQYAPDQPKYDYARQPSYYAPVQEDPNKKIIKQGVLGAGVGAISAGASGGSAGKGALIGAGTNVIGGALLDTLTSSPSPQPQPVYAQTPPQYAAPAYENSPQPLKKKIVRKYNSDGKVISEEEVWE